MKFYVHGFNFPTFPLYQVYQIWLVAEVNLVAMLLNVQIFNTATNSGGMWQSFYTITISH